MPPESQKVSIREKIGYSLGDSAANFVFMTMILFQLNYYTDTLGIAAGVAGTLLLVGRLWDAFFDPLMGIIADRTNTRWGKFRPWVLLAGIPFGVVFWLVYVVPNVGPQGKVVYAALTYVLLMILYSDNNTPYSALMGVITPDSSERTNVARYRFVAAIFGQFIIQTFALPMVDKFGGLANPKAWGTAMAVMLAGKGVPVRRIVGIRGITAGSSPGA